MPEWKAVIDLTGDGDNRTINEPTEKDVLQTTGHALNRLKRRLPGLFNCPDFRRGLCTRGDACEYKHECGPYDVEFQGEKRAQRPWDVFIGGVPRLWEEMQLKEALQSIARNGISVLKKPREGYGFAKFDDPRDLKAVLSERVFVGDRVLDVKPYRELCTKPWRSQNSYLRYNSMTWSQSRNIFPRGYHGRPRVICEAYLRGRCWRQRCPFFHSQDSSRQRMQDRGGLGRKIPMQSSWCVPPVVARDFAHLQGPIQEVHLDECIEQPRPEASKDENDRLQTSLRRERVPTPFTTPDSKEYQPTPEPSPESSEPDHSKHNDPDSSHSKSSEQPAAVSFIPPSPSPGGRATTNKSAKKRKRNQDPGRMYRIEDLMTSDSMFPDVHIPVLDWPKPLPADGREEFDPCYQRTDLKMKVKTEANLASLIVPKRNSSAKAEKKFGRTLIHPETPKSDEQKDR
eukprot:CAMPEP_0170172868 /NCGR_PEP_ID=MMETSP0040_2-20121228/6132_1 /TAXON_ID=641309 /ORGANISM="Lotharella oceanica, Strain CCMP622" /LENGTH=455 /DNA_ID=CAMNT_0010413749 /DNA_START=6 /DNA_END=1374 /DNA_ORIENTATION=+